MTQLQQELKAERSRQQDSSHQLQKCKKTIDATQEEMDQIQRREREGNNKVGHSEFISTPIREILLNEQTFVSKTPVH